MRVFTRACEERSVINEYKRQHRIIRKIYHSTTFNLHVNELKDCSNIIYSRDSQLDKTRAIFHIGRRTQIVIASPLFRQMNNNGENCYGNGNLKRVRKLQSRIKYRM